MHLCYQCFTFLKRSQTTTIHNLNPTRDVEFISNPRVSGSGINTGLYCLINLSAEQQYFRVYVSNPPLIDWVRRNDIRTGSSVMVQGRLNISSYMNRCGAHAVSFRVSAERIMLTQVASFQEVERLPTEHPIEEGLTAEAVARELRSSRLLRSNISEDFMRDLTCELTSNNSEEGNGGAGGGGGEGASLTGVTGAGHGT
ncbi:hypothetical protein BDC45DRAFT_571893 [Circinella umbellata]|nr:hypothetical protein BDC45DRAFT_571893 [Circinella umbellata]